MQTGILIFVLFRLGAWADPLINPNVLIVGGQSAKPNEFPWMVRWFDSLTATSYYHNGCGGSLIAKNLVLTAAHCCAIISPNDTSRIRVVTGDHDTRHIDPYEQFHRVKKVIMHKDFHEKMMHRNDVCILVLETTIECSAEVSPISLPWKKHIISLTVFPQPRNIREFQHSAECYVTGWGHTRERGSAYDRKSAFVLQKLKFTSIIPHGEPMCTSFNGSTGMNVSQDEFCMGLSEGGVDSCQGDSGGPVACNVNDHWELIGVVSWGYKCAKPKSPGVYANVAYFNDWIMKVIHEDEELFASFYNSYMECAPLWIEDACVEECQNKPPQNIAHNNVGCVQICQCQQALGKMKTYSCVHGKPDLNRSVPY